MEKQTDEFIARLVQNGNAEMFGILVTRYEKKLLRYARRFLFEPTESEDMVQEVFIKAYVNLLSYDPNRPFSSWIYRIAHNEFLNAIKKKGRQPLSFFDPDTIFPHPADDRQADQDLKDAELMELMDKCLDKLKPKYKEPLILFYQENLTYENISEILRIPISTVGVRLARAKQLLKKAYTNLNSKYDHQRTK